jgi:S1-C subfamily serine protease
MPRRLSRLAVLVGLLAIDSPTSAQPKKLTKVEIGKRGKAATAFVDVPKGGTGTAFCVHSGGLFVTNEHVVRRGEKDDVILVLNPALEGQHVLKAKVVRTDKDLDLALLRVEGAKGLSSLPLGSIKGLAELSEVVACGFPLGFALSANEKTYPAISVNAGSVTALRYNPKGGELNRIQIDVALTFGNSGGPVLDENAEVVGVVVSGVAGGGKGINLAIPVSQLQAFLSKPDIAFTPPQLNRESLEKPTEFQATVASFVPDAPVPLLKLILQAGDEAPRAFPMRQQGGAWVATAVPVAKARAARVEITARIGTGVVTGTVEDAVFKVGDKPVRLSGVRRIDWRMKPVVLLADGRTTIEGDLAGLGLVEVDVGGQKLKLDLAKATQMTVQPAPEIVSVMASVVAISEGREVARAESGMILRDTARAGPADPATVKITPPPLAEEKVVRRLPDVFTEVVVGGGGRYLIFAMPKLKKLAIFDVNEAKVTKYIPLTEDDITYAAGLNSVVIGLKKAGTLERWSLTTFELEKSALPPFKDDIKTVVMGHGSNGPVVVNGHFLDLDTFRELPISTNGSGWDASARVIPSADGTVYTRWGMNSVTYVLEGSTVQRYEEGGLGHVIAGPDGRDVFTRNGIVSRRLTRADASDASYGYCLPALRGEYFLSIQPDMGKGGGFTIYLRGLKQKVARLEKIDHGLRFDSAGGDTYNLWRKVFFIPDANVIVVLPSSNDRVWLYKFDADAALEKSGQDYLLITSAAPREVKAGATFSYPIKVKSKQGGVTFQLDSGPKGMSVSADGALTWAVSAEAPPGDQEVILTVRDKAGEEVFHTFTLKVVK